MVNMTNKVKDAIFSIWANGARIMRPDLVAFVVDPRKTVGINALPSYPANLIRNLDYRVREQTVGYTLSESDVLGVKFDGTIRDKSVTPESEENKIRAWIVRNLPQLDNWTLALDYVDANGRLYPLPFDNPKTERKVRLYLVAS